MTTPVFRQNVLQMLAWQYQVTTQSGKGSQARTQIHSVHTFTHLPLRTYYALLILPTKIHADKIADTNRDRNTQMQRPTFNTPLPNFYLGPWWRISKYCHKLHQIPTGSCFFSDLVNCIVFAMVFCNNAFYEVGEELLLSVWEEEEDVTNQQLFGFFIF